MSCMSIADNQLQLTICRHCSKRGVNRVENNERRHTIFHDDGIFSTNNLDRFMLFSTEMEPTI